MKNPLKTLLLLSLLLTEGCVKGQSLKIGALTIDSATTDRYLLDCYKHPDTVKEREWDEGLWVGNSMSIQNSRADELKAQPNQFNGDLHRSAIGKAYKYTPYKAHADTLWETWYSDLNGHSGHSKSYSGIKQVPAGTTIEFIGFLVPRKPSETDFIKWKFQTQSK